jgi:hypothetical protein
LGGESPYESYWSTDIERKGGFGIAGDGVVLGSMGSLSGGEWYVLPEIFPPEIF